MQFYTTNLFCKLPCREMYSKFRETPAIRLTKVNRVAVFNLYLMAVLLLWYLMLVVSCICRINALRRSLLYFLFITSWGVHYTTSNPLVSIYISIRFIFWNIWAPLILVYNKYLIMCRTLIENIEYTCSLKSSFIHSSVNFPDVLQDVMSQICSTLFDYPSIRQCAQLQTFIRKCVHTAWSLVSQVPSPSGSVTSLHYRLYLQSPGYTIEYEERVFRAGVHVRHHSSDQTSPGVRHHHCTMGNKVKPGIDFRSQNK